MSTPILATKLYVPLPRPKVVPRPRLIERLNQGLPRKLTLISAPAGFGKSTLVSQWVTNVEAPWAQRIAWLSLDERDNDPTRFLTYFIAALQTMTVTMAVQLGQGALRLLQSAPPAPTESILTALLNEIATHADNFVLVLDDYHLIDTKAVDQALTFLLEHMPPQMHLVIATREDPQLPLARLRARGQLTELRVADLRFGPDEAAGFLSQAMGLDLAAQEIAALETRTEGWIAGLQLAALSMQGHRDAAGFIQSFTGSHHFVLDYLVEEVVHRQTASVQTFLLSTSILDRMCGPLCDALLRAPSGFGQETLETIDRANLFIVSLDNERRWYRYHHLFADLLRQRLQQSVAASPEDAETQTEAQRLAFGGLSLADLHSRASQWFEDNKLETEAFYHAVAAQDFARAADLAERAYPIMDGTFQTATWLGWVQTLPEAMVSVRPVLGVAYAWALLNAGELDASEARLRDAEQWLHGMTEKSAQPQAAMGQMVVADEEQFRTLPASIATARAYRAQTLGDLAGSVGYARQALDLISEEDHARRGVAASLLGLAYWANGELEAAHRALTDGMGNFQMAGHLTFALTGTFGRADIRVTQARLHEAAHTYEHALQLVAMQGESILPITADLYLGLALLQHEWGDAETAAHSMHKSKELGEQSASQNWPYRWSHAQARMQESQGDLDGALLQLEEAERLYIRNPMPDVRPIAALKARIWVKQGRLADALGWVRAQGLSVDDSLSYVREFEYWTLARVLIATYAHDHAEQAIAEALALLERLRTAAHDGQRMGSVIEILVLEALAHHAQGDMPAARAALQQALTLAEPEGYMRIFVDEGTPMADLLARLQAQLSAQPLPIAAAHATMANYIAKLIAALEGEQLQGEDKADVPSTLPSDEPQVEPLIEALSQREIEILDLIALGLSNRQICDRLFLALSTVKGHNRNIFGKLGVQRRTEAIARPHELGLL